MVQVSVTVADWGLRGSLFEKIDSNRPSLQKPNVPTQRNNSEQVWENSTGTTGKFTLAWCPVGVISSASMEAPAFPPPPEEAQERLPSNELAEPPLPPQSAPEEPPNGLPTYTHTVGVFELTVVDDVPNAMRRILLPTSNRPLTAEEQDFIFRRVALFRPEL